MWKVKKETSISYTLDYKFTKLPPYLLIIYKTVKLWSHSFFYWLHGVINQIRVWKPDHGNFSWSQGPVLLYCLFAHLYSCAIFTLCFYKSPSVWRVQGNSVFCHWLENVSWRRLMCVAYFSWSIRNLHVAYKWKLLTCVWWFRCGLEWRGFSDMFFLFCGKACDDCTSSLPLHRDCPAFQQTVMKLYLMS